MREYYYMLFLFYSLNSEATFYYLAYSVTLLECSQILANYFEYSFKPISFSRSRYIATFFADSLGVIERCENFQFVC